MKDFRARKCAEKKAQESWELCDLKAVALKRRGVCVEVESDTLNIASSAWVGAKLTNDMSTHTFEEVMGAPYNLRQKYGSVFADWQQG
jgi:hypothetical protein